LAQKAQSQANKMSDKSSLDYLGNVSGNFKQPINVHTINEFDLMIPAPKINQGNTISLRVKLD